MISYTANSKEHCTRCLENCVECSSSQSCTKCRKGWALVTTDGGTTRTCVQCSENSDDCGTTGASNGLCDKASNSCQPESPICIPPYYKDSLDDRICVACDKEGEFKDDAKRTCIRNCVPNCNVCETTKTCKECKTSFGILESDRARCIPTTAKTGFLCSGNPIMCKSCPDHCKSCEISEKKCDDCESGYYLIDGQCSKCPPHCKVCDHGQKCTECETQWFLMENICVPCEYSGELRAESGGKSKHF